MYSIPLSADHSFNFSKTREDRSLEILQNKDISSLSEKELLDIRESITKMKILDRFCDWAFHHGAKKEALNNIANVLFGKTDNEKGVAAYWLLTHATEEGVRCLFDLHNTGGFSIKFKDEVPLIGGVNIKIPSEMLHFMLESTNNDYKEFIMSSFQDLAKSNPVEAADLLTSFDSSSVDHSRLVVEMIRQLFIANPDVCVEMLSIMIRNQAFEANSIFIQFTRINSHNTVSDLLHAMDRFSTSDLDNIFLINKNKSESVNLRMSTGQADNHFTNSEINELKQMRLDIPQSGSSSN